MLARIRWLHALKPLPLYTLQEGNTLEVNPEIGKVRVGTYLLVYEDIITAVLNGEEIKVNRVMNTDPGSPVRYYIRNEHYLEHQLPV